MNLFLQVALGLLSVAIYVFLDYTVVRWAELFNQEGACTWRLVLVVVAAPAGLLMFGWVGARIGLAAASGFINAGLVAGGALVGLFARREQLNIPQILGLGAALAAIILLNSSTGQTTPP